MSVVPQNSRLVCTKINFVKTRFSIDHRKKESVWKKCVAEPTKSRSLPASNNGLAATENVFHHVLGCDFDVLFVGVYQSLVVTINDPCYLAVV